MELNYRVIRPNDARQYRQRSISVLPRADPTQPSTTNRYVQHSQASDTPRLPTELSLPRETYARLITVRQEQNRSRDTAIAESRVLRERQHEETNRIRRIWEATWESLQEIQEAQRHKRFNDYFDEMMHREMQRVMNEVERKTEEMRRERDETLEQIQLEQDRMLAELTEEQTRIQDTLVEALQEAETRERIRQENSRECAVCMEAGDVTHMVQVPCTHWYCHEDLESKSSHAFLQCRLKQSFN